jgi:hypothetical protein
MKQTTTVMFFMMSIFVMPILVMRNISHAELNVETWYVLYMIDSYRKWGTRIKNIADRMRPVVKLRQHNVLYIG